MRFFMMLAPLIAVGCLVSCVNGQPPKPFTSAASLEATHAEGHTIAERFAPPPGYTRTEALAGSFGENLRSLSLKPAGAQVHLFDGSLKRYQGAQAAVINMSVGDKDLQQCADAIMRLRAEFLFAAGRKEEITFNFTSGFKAPFVRWINGERIKVKGNACSWVNGGKAGSTHEDLLRYLEMIFSYAGTASLSKELKDCSSSPVRPGDVFIQGGHPGHAVIVVDVVDNPTTGEQMFLPAQSYMPAQEIHVLKNLRDPGLSPWFKLNDGDELLTPEWTFQWDQRKRWP